MTHYSNSLELAHSTKEIGRNMARRASTQPTEGELEILRHLWEAGEPLELGALCARLREEKDVATTTVATMLKVMLGKQLVARTKGPKSWLWAAKVSRDATASQMLTRLVDKVFDGSAQLLVSQLIDTGKLSDEDRRQIVAMLKGAEKKATEHKGRSKE